MRKEYDLTLEQLAGATGLLRVVLGGYETDNTKNLCHYALVRLAKFYGVTSDYLMGLFETQNPPNVELTDLCLGDGMIDLLKNERINTPLLCELLMHKNSVKLLADIEIYVAGMAAAPIF